MSVSSPVYALREALGKSGCAVCRLCHGAAANHIDSLLYEYVNDPDVRQEFVASGGFCQRHAQTCRQSPNALGVAILYRSLLQNALRHLDGADGNSMRSRLADWFGDSGPNSLSVTCAACTRERDIERQSIDALISGLRDDVLHDSLAASTGLCMTHYSLAERCASSEEIRTTLVSAQHVALVRLRSQIDRFIETQDYLRADQLLTASEGASRLLAIELLAPEGRV
jgi:hypothetical protein